MTLTVALIYPQLLGTYGDRGNALVLQHRARLRDIDCDIVVVSPGDALVASADIYLLGGGEDNAQTLAADLLKKQQTTLEQALEKGYLLAVCAGFQILGHSFPIANGKFHDGLGMIDITTRHGSPRIIGELVTTCSIEGIGELTGFENHGGHTTLGKDAQPLGEVVHGRGNGVESSGFVDGYRSDHIIATYLHGPVLARNPVLADYYLAQAMDVDLGDLVPIEDDPAEVLHRERLGAVR
ncbi:MAG TPA: glutamine amidotransferase [Acidimicrobiia bacterium]|nr:glutamine amidotransferase [Acidimicrobiia bacterium]